jgi:hypothetical protein
MRASAGTELVHYRYRWYLPAHLAHKPEQGEEGHAAAHLHPTYNAEKNDLNAEVLKNLD